MFISPAPPRAMVTATAFVLAALATVALALPARAEIDPAKQMLLGNPDRAKASPASRERYLIQRPQYALSYSDALHYPNWVSWKLDASDIGNEPRGQFQPDTSLPKGFTTITPGDYTRTGYDRGHNCPSADRSASRADNAAVFLMSNMTPQSHGMNAGPWEKLEAEGRNLARRGNSLYIVAGHGFSSPTHGTAGRKKIAVPDFAWKVVVVAGRGKPIDASCRVIAVKMPNINTIAKKRWQDFLVTPADIEKATGLTFFGALPKAIGDALRSKKDGGEASASSREDRRVWIDDPSFPGGKPTGDPTSGQGDSSGSSVPARPGDVWVNLSSGKFWREGTQFYGKTKRGKYMSEADAIKAGYKAAGGQ